MHTTCYLVHARTPPSCMCVCTSHLYIMRFLVHFSTLHVPYYLQIYQVHVQCCTFHFCPLRSVLLLWRKIFTTPDFHQEGGRSTKGTSCLLEDRRYIPCTLYMLHSERVTYFRWISLCHRYDTYELDTSTRPTSRIYPDPVTSQNSPSRIISSASIASSRVTDISRTESTNSAQPNGSASDHPTSTPGATNPIIPRRSERLSQPPERYSPGIFFTDVIRRSIGSC